MSRGTRRCGISPTSSASRPITSKARSGWRFSDGNAVVAPVVDQIVSGKSAAYRKASEVLHGAAPSWDRRATHYRVLWECGYGDLIRADFYRLFAFPAGVTGQLLDAGCGTGIEAVNLQRQAPGLRIQGVDVSSIALAGAVAKRETGNAAFYQAALERLPF